MSNFTVRVELHSATWQDYDALHRAMANEGFSRTIRSDAGTTHQLPTAEYVISGGLTIEDVRERAKRAADRTGKSSEAIVAETAKWAWYGLADVSRSGTYRRYEV